MAEQSARFVAYGFAKGKEVTVGGTKITIDGKTPTEKLEFIKKKREELAKQDSSLASEFDAALEKIADHEWVEVAKDQMTMTDFPKSISRYYLGVESWHQSIEPYYYWCCNFMGDIGFPIIDKITDIFTAAEHSSFYGAATQRLGLAQDKVSQYLATIGKMVKDLFQLVRELRWIDERLEIYRAAFGEDKEGKKLEKGPDPASEQALKGMWVDLVDGVVGGQRTGSNLFVMAQQLQFTALPDLFFAIHPKSVEQVDKLVEEKAKDFNQPLRNLLKRKLAQYVAWKHATFDEMKSRRRFTLDYLRQHYHVIKMYMNWVKPYIRHIERLSGEQNLLNNPRLIAAFESSLVEIEILGRMKGPSAKDSYSCLLMTFEYHTKPSMQYPGDAGYHRGPIHVGSTRITWRSYAWTMQQIEAYKKMKEREDLELLASVDKSLKSALDQLGKDFEDYIKEAETLKKEEKEERPEKPPMKLMEPFAEVGKGVAELFSSMIPSLPKAAKKKPGAKEDPDKGTARRMTWIHYNIFKKAHGFLAW